LRTPYPRNLYLRMKSYLVLLAALLAAGQAGAQAVVTSKTLPYPQTRKVDTTTTYFGTKVADPYRGL
jgi:prolyl oligopeptidase